MSDFEFEENSNEFYNKTQKLLGRSRPNSAVGFLLNSGIVKNEKQANAVLMALVVVILVIAGWVFWMTNNESIESVTGDDGLEYSGEEYIENIKYKNNKFDGIDD
jgi:hypothetical protein